MFDKEGMDKIVSAAVIDALSARGPELLTELVNRSLEKKVDRITGRPPQYGTGDVTLLEYLAGEQINYAVEAAVREYMNNRQDALREAVKAKMEEGGIADAFVDSIIRQIATDYHIQFRVNMTLPERD